jgi:murein DD-endopeptidase MepM/ murein hydrolase activator NlpD
MRIFARIGVLGAFLAASAAGQSVSSPVLSTSASEERCAAGPAVSRVRNTERQIFLQFNLLQTKPIRRLTVEWLSPGARVYDFENYESLPSGRSLCFLTQIPVAGFDAAALVGDWSVRVVADGRVIAQKNFQLEGDPANTGGPRIRSIARRELSPTETEITLEGSGLHGETSVFLATYSPTNSWEYIAELRPTAAEMNRIVLVYKSALAPGEYWFVAKNLDAAQSPPARLLVASDQGYALPFAAGETWVITQLPYGGASHWGRSLHAFDLAPVSLRTGGCVTAMRAGIVHAFDRGEGQRPNSKSFGNYITIAHDDGEFSHYAHLKAGSFAVRTGQRVEAGQALAIVGNSGHTFGMNGGYHVHVHVTREPRAASQSIPFAFRGVNMRKGVPLENTVPLVGSCGVQFDGPVNLTKNTKKPTKAVDPQWKTAVAVGEWWTQALNVPKGTRVLEILLAWARQEAQKVDLYLISPSGAQYGGPYVDARKLLVNSPEPGDWQIRVQGTRSDQESIEFEAIARLGGLE